MTTATSGIDWRDPAWEASAHAWIRERQRALGMRPEGAIERFRIRPWSAVLRVAAPDAPLWFKANTPDSAFEAGLCVALAGWTPDRVVAPLAVDAGLGWILTADAGPTMRDEKDAARPPDAAAALARWEPMLRAYAELQRDLTPRVTAMLDLGVPDLRPAAMPGHLAALLADAGVRDGLGADRQAAVRDLVPAYEDWCAELAGDGVPASLQHDDLSHTNVFATGGGFRFFDWADASVSHPFGSLLVALHVAMHEFDLAPHDPRLVRLRDAYLEPWTATHTRARLERSATLAMRVARVGRAVSWQRALRGTAMPLDPMHATAVVEWLAAIGEPDLT